MNPLAALIPEESAQVDSPLARALAYAQQQKAQLGPAPTMDASAATDMAAGQRQQELAAALMGSDYVQNSGPLGALAQVFSAYKGNKLDKQAGETVADALQRQVAQQDAQAQYADRVKAFDEGPGRIEKMAAQAQALGMELTPEELASGKFREAPAPKGFQATGGFLVNKDTGETRAIEGYQASRQAIAAAGRSTGGGGEGKPPSGYRWTEDGDLVAIKGGPADKPAEAPGAPKPLTPDQAMKASLLENSARAATNWQALVLGENGEYNDIAARAPEAQALLRQSISAKLRAESGASITAGEIENETERYMGGLLQSDGTARQRATALTEDLQTQLGAFGADGEERFTRATARKPAPAPAVDALLEKYK